MDENLTLADQEHIDEFLKKQW